MHIIVLAPNRKAYQFSSSNSDIINNLFVSRYLFNPLLNVDAKIMSYIEKFIEDNLISKNISNLIIKDFPDFSNPSAPSSFEVDIKPIQQIDGPSILFDFIKNTVYTHDCPSPDVIHLNTIHNCLYGPIFDERIIEQMKSYIYLIENKIFVIDDENINPEFTKTILGNLKSKIEGRPVNWLKLPISQTFYLDNYGVWKIKRFSPYHQKCGKPLAHFITCLNSYGFMFGLDVLEQFRQNTIHALQLAYGKNTINSSSTEHHPLFQETIKHVQELFLLMHEKVVVSQALPYPNASPNTPVFLNKV